MRASQRATSEDAQPLLEAFERRAPIAPRERRRVVDLARVQELEPGEWLVRAGRIWRELGFIVSGLVRHVIPGDGAGDRELVLGFDMEQRFVADPACLLHGAPAERGIQALEPTRLLLLSTSALEELQRRHPCFDRVARRLGEEAMLRRDRKERDLALRSPRARYLRMVERRPYLLGRVPFVQLASYLRMAPETLSRVRSRLVREA